MRVLHNRSLAPERGQGGLVSSPPYLGTTSLFSSKSSKKSEKVSFFDVIIFGK
jgi:hypothetical protein